MITTQKNDIARITFRAICFQLMSDETTACHSDPPDFTEIVHHKKHLLKI